MVKIYSLSATVESTNGQGYAVTAQPAIPGSSGKWQIDIIPSGSGEPQIEFSSVPTLSEALSIGLLLVPI